MRSICYAIIIVDNRIKSKRLKKKIFKREKVPRHSQKGRKSQDD
jgi:hypothetical protein